MKDEQIEKAVTQCSCLTKLGCCVCPYLSMKNSEYSCVIAMSKDALNYINRLKSEKQLAETQLKELLSALYRRTEKPFTLERKDIIELAKDYGIKEEELK